MTSKSLQQLLVDQSQKTLWPTPKDEAWKYFDFKKLKKFETLEVPEIQNIETYAINVDTSASHCIVIGESSLQISKDLHDLGVGASVSLGHSALNELSKIDRRFLSINKQSLVINLDFKDVRSDETIQVKYTFADSKKSVLGLTVKYNLINSDVGIYEMFDQQSFPSKAFISMVTQVEQTKSKFRQFVIQENLLVEQGFLYTSEAQLKKESDYKLFVTTLGSQLVRNQNNVHILSEGANAEVLTFTLAGQSAFSESRTEIAHYQEGSVSRQLFKTIVSDEAKSVFNGRIYIDAEAQKTDSGQSCKGLLLGEKAQINAKPELEIYADDVKAAHGAAIGQVSKDEVFYLLSRGISPEKAYELLAQAFAGEVIQGVSDMKLRTLISNKIKMASAPIFADLIQSYKDQGKKQLQRNL